MMKTLRLSRDPNEKHRAATSLELLFDLVFVTAIATAGSELHHGVAQAHFSSLLAFAMAFAVIWWAWMNFTWYASAFDNDDIFHRSMTLIIMAGALIISAGIPQLMHTSSGAAAIIGFVLMRIGMIALWIRTARRDPHIRTTALTYAGGIFTVQILWCLRALLDPSWLIPSFLICFALELLVPVIAEKQGNTPYHPHHIAERYSLLVIIVLGEGLVGTMASITALTSDIITADLIAASIGSLLLIFVSWWWYFSVDQIPLVTSNSLKFIFAYGHIIVFVALASYGPLLKTVADLHTGGALISPTTLLLCLTACASAFFVFTAWLHYCSSAASAALTTAAVSSAAMLTAALTIPSAGYGVLAIGVISALQLAAHLTLTHKSAVRD